MVSLTSYKAPLKKIALAGVAALSLGVVTLSASEPAQAFRGGFGGFHRFGGFHGGFGRYGGYGFRGGYGRFGGYGGWGSRRFGWGGWGYRRFGWGVGPAIGFGLGYGLANAGYGYGYPYGGYGYAGGEQGYAGGYGEGVGPAGYRRVGYYRHGVCSPYQERTHLEKRYCS